MTDTFFPLGRNHVVDTRDLNYRMSAYLPKKLSTRRQRTWKLGPILNQLRTPHCVGFAGAQLLQTTPAVVKLLSGKDDGDTLYYGCKVFDGEPRVEDGTSARSLMKELQRQGRLKSYAWATTPEEVAGCLLSRGPVLMGVPWHQAMFTPDVSGVVHPTGPVAGGHEFLANDFQWDGVKVLDGTVGAVNSWGTGWGMHGLFYLTLRELWGLVQEGGDACMAVDKVA